MQCEINSIDSTVILFLHFLFRSNKFKWASFWNSNRMYFSLLFAFLSQIAGGWEILLRKDSIENSISCKNDDRLIRSLCLTKLYPSTLLTRVLRKLDFPSTKTRYYMQRAISFFPKCCWTFLILLLEI